MIVLMDQVGAIGTREPIRALGRAVHGEAERAMSHGGADVSEDRGGVQRLGD